MIAVTFAVPHESAALRARLKDAKPGSGRDWMEGKIGDGQVIVAHTGMGPAAAERSVSALLAERRPRGLISAGYAGALDPVLAHGDVFVAENFTSPALLDLSPARRGILTTQEAAAETPAQKAALARATGAHAVDMETAAIARVCAANSLPLLALRVISDTAVASIPVPLPISYDLEKQRPRVLALLIFLARNPARIRPFVRFVRGLTPARAALTAAILGVLQQDHFADG